MAQHPAGDPYGYGSGSTTLSTWGMGLAIAAACIACVGLIPCLGWFNWFTLAIGGIGNILSWIGLLSDGQRDIVARNRAIIGLVVSFSALIVGGVRLALGGGCL